MRERIEELVEQVSAIEEEVRDLAYERLADRAREPDGDDAAAAARDQKRLEQARRALARAAGALRTVLGDDPEPW